MVTFHMKIDATVKMLLLILSNLLILLQFPLHFGQIINKVIHGGQPPWVVVLKGHHHNTGMQQQNPTVSNYSSSGACCGSWVWFLLHKFFGSSYWWRGGGQMHWLGRTQALAPWFGQSLSGVQLEHVEPRYPSTQTHTGFPSVSWHFPWYRLQLGLQGCKS